MSIIIPGSVHTGMPAGYRTWIERKRDAAEAEYLSWFRVPAKS